MLTFSDVRFHNLGDSKLSDVLATIKQLSGHDPIRIEEKYKEISTVRFYGLILLTSNFPFPIDETDFSAQYRRIVNIHLNKVIAHRDKVLDYAQVRLLNEALNFLLLAVILQSKMDGIVSVIDGFNLVEILHDNNEEKFKLSHSPDPVRLVNFILDRMHQKTESPREGRQIAVVHQVAVEFVNYLMTSKGFNVPIADLGAHIKQYTEAMDDNNPRA